MRIELPTKEQIPSLRALWKEAFGDTDAFLDTFFGTAFSPERCRCICEGDTAVAALYLFDCLCAGRRTAYLYAVATARSHRGQGLCRALMEDTHAHLRKEGYALAVLVPGEKPLFGFYEKFDYRPFGGIRTFSCKAAEETIPLCEIGIEEYAHIRRRLLPPNAVLQEGENLAFLKTQASLYKGDGCLLAASKNGRFLRGIELLGESTVAPHIVRTLGCKTGTFRTPGEEPFAMALPLAADAPAPEYFGLAFD